MESPISLFQFLKSGEINLLTKGKKSLHLKIQNKNLDINLLDKELMKELVKAASSKKTFWGGLGRLKHIADNLKKEGLTVSISYEGSIILKLGSEARSSLLGKAVEIGDLSRLLRLVLM